MDFSALKLSLYGGGKMGMAMFEGWLAKGLKPENAAVYDPFPSDHVKSFGAQVNPDNFDADVIVLAVKPQIMNELLEGTTFSNNAVVISVAAGCPISQFENSFGKDRAIVRTMPNTPSAVGAGMTVIVGNQSASVADLDMTENLMAAVGEVARVDDEALIDAVTGLSGSGPAYVFHMIEAMTEAGIAAGLDADLSRKLARTTVAGAGKLVIESGEEASVLRQNVTSPGGTTAAGLNVLMDDASGLGQLMKNTVQAATDRSRALGKS